MATERRSLFRWLWEAIGHGETISFIIHTEFVRTWLWPLVGTMLAGGSGIFGGVPLMWVVMASSITFAAIMIGMVGHLALKERNTPQNKLVTVPIFHCDLTPTETLIGNRHQRRSARATQLPGQNQKLSASQIDPGVNRTLDKGQLGVEVRSNAFFPISCILVSAETEIEGDKPPRSKFPKDASILQAGGTMRILDDPIELEQLPCRRLAGKMDLLIKYGYPGNEIFELRIRDTVDIVVESFGQVKTVMSYPMVR